MTQIELGSAPAPLPTARPIAANRLFQIVDCDRLTCAALFLTVLGWSLMWARALSIVGLVPVWLCVCVFLLGLALIPFRPIFTPRPGLKRAR